MKVLQVLPENKSTDNLLDSRVTIKFDKEVDLDSLKAGGFVLSTEAKNLTHHSVISMDFTPKATAKKVLDGNPMLGVIQGKCTLAADDTLLFTPDSQLLPIAKYRVLLSTSVVSRTIESVTPSVGMTGTGSIEVTGPYTANTEESYKIVVTQRGPLGVAVFKLVTVSTDAEVLGISTDRLVKLLYGLQVSFKSGVYEVGDEWTIVCKVGEPLESDYLATFTTGTQVSTQIPNEQKSVSIIEREVDGYIRLKSVAVPGEEHLELMSVTPANNSSNINLVTIVCTFNKPLDPLSITEENVKAIMETLPPWFGYSTSYSIKIGWTVNENILTVRFTG